MKIPLSILLVGTVVGTAFIVVSHDPFIRSDGQPKNQPATAVRIAAHDASSYESERIIRNEPTDTSPSVIDPVATSRNQHRNQASATTDLKVVSSGRNTRIVRNSDIFPRPSEFPTTSSFPAIWIDIPNSVALTPGQQNMLQQEAETLLEQLATADSEEFPAAVKADLINASDLDFRRKYGVRAWLSHHAQAHALFNHQNKK